MTFADELTRLPLITPNKKIIGVFTVNSVYVPALTEAYVAVKCPSRFSNTTVYIEPNPKLLITHVATTGAITNCEKDTAVCKVLNFRLTPRVLPKHTLIAKVESINNIVSCETFRPGADVIEDDLSAENIRVVQTPEILEKFKEDY